MRNSVPTATDLRKALASKGIDGYAADMLVRFTAPSRHAARVAAIQAIGEPVDVVGIIALDRIGVGGRCGVEGLAAARHPALRQVCGKGRKQADDADAWNSAIAEILGDTTVILTAAKYEGFAELEVRHRRADGSSEVTLWAESDDRVRGNADPSPYDYCRSPNAAPWVVAACGVALIRLTIDSEFRASELHGIEFEGDAAAWSELYDRATIASFTGMLRDARPGASMAAIEAGRLAIRAMLARGETNATLLREEGFAKVDAHGSPENSEVEKFGASLRDELRKGDKTLGELLDERAATAAERNFTTNVIEAFRKTPFAALDAVVGRATYQHPVSSGNNFQVLHGETTVERVVDALCAHAWSLDTHPALQPGYTLYSAIIDRNLLVAETCMVSLRSVTPDTPLAFHRHGTSGIIEVVREVNDINDYLRFFTNPLSVKLIVNPVGHVESLILGLLDYSYYADRIGSMRGQTDSSTATIAGFNHARIVQRARPGVVDVVGA